MAGTKPILVTGSHRSGTTWVGKMLALHHSIAYLHEPFNKFYSNTGYGIRPDHWYQFINEDNEDPFFEKINRLLAFKFLSFPPSGFGSIDDVKIYLKRNYEISFHKIHHRRPLVKDPLALFSTPWLERRFSFVPVVMIRNPAAFYHSLQKRNWQFNFNELYCQKSLMEQYLSPFNEAVREYAGNQYPLIDQTILLWKVVHHVIKEYEDKYQDWLFVRHEDVAQDPLSWFEYLYDQLGIPFSDKIGKTIEKYSGKEKQETPGANPVNQIRRDSRSIAQKWKSELEPSTIEYIYEQTSHLLHHFYPEEC